MDLGNIKKKKIHGKKIILRSVKISDVTNNYVEWLKDEEVIQFLELRFTKHTKDTVKEFVRNIQNDSNFLFLAIIRNDSKKHIGNIKLGPIDWIHQHGDIGILIGDKDSLRKGYASDAIKTLTDFVFDELNLHKITAGIYEENIGSLKAFLKSGFEIEGLRKEQFRFNGKYVGQIIVGKINKNQ
ncbi:MAG: GNAT family N-acetyltransferase [Nitrosarchaeum sp.]